MLHLHLDLLFAVQTEKNERRMLISEHFFFVTNVVRVSHPERKEVSSIFDSLEKRASIKTSATHENIDVD